MRLSKKALKDLVRDFDSLEIAVDGLNSLTDKYRIQRDIIKHRLEYHEGLSDKEEICLSVALTIYKQICRDLENICYSYI